VFGTLNLDEVVVQPVEPLAQHELVLGGPIVERSQARGIQPVQSTTSHRTTLDETGLAEDSKMLGDLRLRDIEIVNDRPDRHLSSDQYVEDLATVGVGNGVEDVGNSGRANHVIIICQNWNMSIVGKL